MEKKFTNVLVCSTGSTPHNFEDGHRLAKRGQLEYFNYIVDLDGTWIEGKKWKKGDTIRVAYLGGLKRGCTQVEDTRTEEQAQSLISNLVLLVIDNNINPNRISVYEERQKVTALERLRKGIEIEQAGVTGFTYEEFREELENYLGFFGLLEDSDFEDPDQTGFICLN